MIDVEGKLEMVREAGRLGINLLECDTPPVSRYTPDAPDGGPAFTEDERYWDAFSDIHGLIDAFAQGDPEVKEWRDQPVPFRSIHADRTISGVEFAQVDINYAADGDYLINLEFQIDDGWATSINAKAENLTKLDIGRRIAGVEIAVLAHELGSPAETLDYWMTNELYGGKQARWAEVRQASRQTVSDRVRSARTKLENGQDREA